MTISTATPARYSGCPMCSKALSIAEVIERHCENCGRPTHPEDMRETNDHARRFADLQPR